MTHPDVVTHIEQILQQLRPAIQSDGGDIQLVKYENGIVYVRLQGACSTCPISLYTLKFGVEEALREQIPAIKEVVAIEE